MSNKCHALVQERVVGSAVKKTVLLYMADRASDDGSGIWTSKVRMSQHTELSRRSVQNAITEFTNDGIIECVGKRGIKNGYVYEYRIVLPVVLSLPHTSPEDVHEVHTSDQDVQEVHMTCAGGAHQSVQEVHINHPRTILEPSETRQGAPDLFSAKEEHQKQSASDRPNSEKVVRKENAQIELIEQGFREFWEKIWPSHPRKKPKADCLKVYVKTCQGRHPKNSTKVTPRQINDAAAKYIASVNDQKYLVGPLVWLNEPGWEFIICEKPAPRSNRFLDIAREYGGGA